MIEHQARALAHDAPSLGDVSYIGKFYENLVITLCSDDRLRCTQTTGTLLDYRDDLLAGFLDGNLADHVLCNHDLVGEAGTASDIKTKNGLSFNVSPNRQGGHDENEKEEIKAVTSLQC